MSEYQYYEFLAVDRPLSTAEQAAVRALSTRARITATSFTNTYHWGNFRGNPRELVEKYYDAQLYVTNWGTHGVTTVFCGGVHDPRRRAPARACLMLAPQADGKQIRTVESLGGPDGAIRCRLAIFSGSAR